MAHSRFRTTVKFMRISGTILRVFLIFLSLWNVARADSSLGGGSAKLFQQALEDGRFSGDFKRINATIIPTSDSRSFFVSWKPVEAPTLWIVSLHGAGKPAKGYATDDLAIWHKHLRSEQIGVICLQWWFGHGSLASDFYTPEDMYREIELVLSKIKATKGKIMLHGFSRGAANTYALAAIDAGEKGEQYFSLVVASSGGVVLDYPPNKAVIAGKYGKTPLKNTKWITVAGAKDYTSGRDGIEIMRETARWLENQDAVVVKKIEDKDYGHGALVLNPKNVKEVVRLFLETSS